MKLSLDDLKNNIKKNSDTWIGAAAVLVLIAGVGVLIGQPKSSETINSRDTPVVSNEELREALNKCIILDVADDYDEVQNASEVKLFDKARKSCEAERTTYDSHLDQFVKEINDRWLAKSNTKLSGEPLTYYANVLETDSDDTQEDIAVLATTLQAINIKKKQAAEQQRKAEEEAAKKQAEAAAAAAAQTQYTYTYQYQTAPSNTNTGSTGSGRMVEGYCKDGTPAYGDPSARGKANACYGHKGWRDEY